MVQNTRSRQFDKNYGTRSKGCQRQNSNYSFETILLSGVFVSCHLVFPRCFFGERCSKQSLWLLKARTFQLKTFSIIISIKLEKKIIQHISIRLVLFQSAFKSVISRSFHFSPKDSHPFFLSFVFFIARQFTLTMLRRRARSDR